MPVYSHTKVRDMSRSVLPANRRRSRSTARDLEMIRRTARRQVRAQLRQARYIPLDFDQLNADLEQWPTQHIRQAVRERREADNVAAVMRWAPRASAHLRIEDRYSWVRSRMPDSIIGWHAMTHVRYADDMTPEYEHEGALYSPQWRARNRARLERARFERYCAVHQALRHIIESGLLRQFNYENKRPWHDPQSGRWYTARTLHGLHDIEDYIASVYGRGGWVRHQGGRDPILEWLNR